MAAYYNEHDPKAAATIRELVKRGEIAPGDVDERSIEDVTPAELAGYTQVHCFAGAGVWSRALRDANWPDDKPCITGSCPCQPFSAAGKGLGFGDARHLWPTFHRLIDALQFPVVFGEQVSSKDGLLWYESVKADMNRSGYALVGFDLPSSAFGSPHIRQRLYFMGVKR